MLLPCDTPQPASIQQYETALADEEAIRTHIYAAWTPYIDRGSDKIYFYNKFLQVAAWSLPPNEKPDEAGMLAREAEARLRKELQEEDTVRQALERAWTPYTDKASGHTYYHNKISRRTQWHDPLSEMPDETRALPATGEARLAVEATDRSPPEETPDRRVRVLDVHTSLLVPPQLDSHTSLLVPPEAIGDDARQAVLESAPEPASSSAMRERVVRAECSSPRAGTSPMVCSLLWPKQNTQQQSEASAHRPARDDGFSYTYSEYGPATDSGFTEHSEHRPAMPPDSEDPATIYEEDSEADKWIVGCQVHKGESGDAAIWPTYRMRDKAEGTWWRPQAVPIHRAKWLYEYAVQQWQLRNPEEAAQVGADGIQPIV